MTNDQEQPLTSDDWINVIVSPQALAAIRQLPDAEQAVIFTARHAIAEHGLASAPGVKATQLDAARQAYLLRIDGAPDLRVLAHQLNSTMVEISDVVRAETIHNLIHAS